MEHTPVELYLTPERSLALANFLKRLDHDALVRYAHPSEKSLTEQALKELTDALADAGFAPR